MQISDRNTIYGSNNFQKTNRTKKQIIQQNYLKKQKLVNNTFETVLVMEMNNFLKSRIHSIWIIIRLTGVTYLIDLLGW